MQSLVLIVAAFTVPLVLGYDAAYDNIDIDKIIADDAAFTAYVNCLLDKGPCDVENSEKYKEILPEVIATACAKCSPNQKTNVRKSVNALKEKKPEDFEQMIVKYDIKGEQRDKFIAFMSGTD